MSVPVYGTIEENRIHNSATMRPTEFSADTIIALLRKQTIATLPEVMAALGPRASRRTAFRKLKDLDARTSYSHRGGYYTLDALADFDEHGLWSFAGVRFSRTGTLIATAESFVNHAEAGHFVDELDNLLAVGTQDPLRKLVGDGRLTRHKLAGQFLYCAADRAQQTHQLRARRLLMATPNLQHRLCNRHGLRVTVAHYPPATSKWNPIEHRLFCVVSKNWAGRPLDSYETILKYLRTTRTATGLRVRAHLVRKTYKTGVKVTDAQMRELRITPNSFLPKWNYTIEPM